MSMLPAVLRFLVFLSATAVDSSIERDAPCGTTETLCNMKGLRIQLSVELLLGQDIVESSLRTDSTEPTHTPTKRETNAASLVSCQGRNFHCMQNSEMEGLRTIWHS